MAWLRYENFLVQHFFRTETDSWIVFQRENPSPAVEDGNVATTRQLENR
jgi:hypothetical protein